MNNKRKARNPKLKKKRMVHLTMEYMKSMANMGTPYKTGKKNQRKYHKLIHAKPP